jgi:hypothetical protein
VRIKSRWHNKKRPKSVEEIASAVGFNIWKIASTTANKMYSDGFNFRDNAQLLDLIGELAIFQLQLADRIAYERMPDEERQRFSAAVAKHIIGTMISNQTEELGPGEYQGPFIEKINQHLDGYADFGVNGGEPSYPMLRYLGEQAEAVMGGTLNKWVKEQVMEVEAPEMVKTLRRALDSLLPIGDDVDVEEK